MKKVWHKTLFILIFKLTSFVTMASDPNFVVHTVQSGDQLMTISNLYYGTHQRWQEILDVNPDVNPDALYIGQEIIIPNPRHNLSAAREITISTQEETIEIIESKPELEDIIAIEDEVEVEVEVEKEVVKEAVAEIPEVIKPVAEVKTIEEPIKPVRPTPTTKKDPSEDFRKKALRLKKELIEKESKIVWQQRQLQLLSNKEKEFLNWEREKAELRKEVSMLREENIRLEKENQNLLQNNRIQLSANLGLAESEVMQEKSRILSNILWINRNTQKNKCQIKVHSDDQLETKLKVERFIAQVKTILGEDKVFFDSSTNSVKFHLPGPTVKGITPSVIDSASADLLSELSELMIHLPIKNMSVKGYHPNQTIRSGDQLVDSALFMLTQAHQIRDFFVINEGWSSRLITAGSLTPGHRSPSSYRDKHFKVKVEFQQMRAAQRGLASLESSHSLDNAQSYMNIFEGLSSNLFTQLQEPQFSHIEIYNNELHIHLASHYFFSRGSENLSPQGRHRIDSIMNLFSSVPDSTYSIVWVPSSSDRNDSEDIDFKRLTKLQDYVQQNFLWSRGRLETRHAHRFYKMDSPDVQKVEQGQGQIIFKVIPNSAHWHQGSY